MPLIRRMPKRGFGNARHATVYLAVNLMALNRFEDGTRVDVQAIKQAGLANGPGDGVKILGRGQLTRKLTVVADAFSASARKQIEALGGVCETLTAAPANS